MKWLVVFEDQENDAIDDLSEYIDAYLENTDEIAAILSIVSDDKDIIYKVRKALQK